jgi:hypothetical protein
MKCLPLLKHCNHGFESHLRNGCLSVYSVFVLSCVGSGLNDGPTPIQGFLLIVYKIKRVKEVARAHATFINGCVVIASLSHFFHLF